MKINTSRCVDQNDKLIKEAILKNTSDISTKQNANVYTTATLLSSSWLNKSITVTVTGVTENNTITVCPAPASITTWATAGIYCSEQGTNSLTFTCNTVPSSDVVANIIIMS